MSDIFKKILEVEFNITDSNNYPLKDLNEISEDEAKKFNLLTNKSFRKFQKKVLEKKLP